MTKNYQIPIDNWQDITLDVAKFYFSQAETKLKETLDTHKEVSGKSFQILRIYITLLFVLLGSSISFYSSSSFSSSIFWASAVGLLPLIIGIYFIYRNINTSQVVTLGVESQYLIYQGPAQSHPKSEIQYLEILINMIQQFPEWIDDNMKLNTKRTSDYRKSLNILCIWLPLILIVSFVVAEISG